MEEIFEGCGVKLPIPPHSPASESPTTVADPLTPACKVDLPGKRKLPEARTAGVVDARLTRWGRDRSHPPAGGGTLFRPCRVTREDRRRRSSTFFVVPGDRMSEQQVQALRSVKER